ncbi:transcriptional regulator ATRX isoform X8 [Schistocerca gregaria]|uniref:transcriptional regulator ATRX isoform X8 n=1 Tax=Schistocerca gregaria TaxID=7010 RepID=UPI00211E2059|nr:transcriptional regulator ATRX isoform X8 [Schistocerca gregaria]
MSGDVQPRKRKEKRRKKDSEEIPTSFSSDEQLHVHKDASTGGNICAKILFFLLSSVLLVMIGLVVFEYRGSADDETLVPVSKWAPTFDGWLETPVKHDEHADVTESGEQELGDNRGRRDEIIDKQQKVTGVHEKIKAVSEEEADVPRREQEEEVSETTQPVEGTSTFTVGQKPHEQHKSQDQGQAKFKAPQAAAKQKGVKEKPIAAKHEKREALHSQEHPALKSKGRTHSTEQSAVKNNGFPSGPGETGQGQKAEDVTTSKVSPSKKQKVSVGTTKDSPSEATLPKKQKDDAGPTLKHEPLPTKPSKPTVSGGKNFKDKDVLSDGVHSPPKASRIGDKIEHSSKLEKSGSVHKVTEQSSPTKLDSNERVSVSKSPHVDKSTEEGKKPLESKDNQRSKSVHSASASGVKNSKFDAKDAQTMTDDSVKLPDLKTDAHGKLAAAGKSESFGKAKAASNSKEKESVGVESTIKESGSLNSQIKQVKVGHSTGEKKLMEKRTENLRENGHRSNREKENEQFTSKLDHHTETANNVVAKDSNAAKVHEDSRDSKVNVEKQKASFSVTGKTYGDGNSEVPVTVSTVKSKKASADYTKNRTPEKNGDVNAARKRSGNDYTPPESNAYPSKPTDTKVSAAVPESTLKHSVGDEGVSSKNQEFKPNVQSASSRKTIRDKEVRSTSTSENRPDYRESSGNKPVNSNTKKPSHGQKVAPKQIENEVTQPESERASKRKAVPSQHDSDMVGDEIKSSKMIQDKPVEEEEEEDEPEPSGVALKFGVGVALVIVAHVVLVKKWNSDENLAAPDTSDASQTVPQMEQQQISKQIPQILVETETEKDSEESSYLSSEYITRRQTLLPDDLVHDSPQRELEESESSVPSEEDSDDGQEEFIFKQNVYKAENAFKASHRDEKAFSEEKPYKQQSFEELLKKYHEHTPEGSDIESDEDEQEEEEEEEEEEEDNERDLDDDDDDDEDEPIDDEDDIDNEDPEDEEEILANKGQGSKISTTPDTEDTSPRKFVVDTQKEQRIASVEQESGNNEEGEMLAGGKEEEKPEEEDAGELDSEDDSLGENFKYYQLPKTRKLHREEDDESGSDKEIPVVKSKIPKNMGGQNAQVYSKADITNDDDWHIIEDLDRADDDAEENPEVAIHRYDTILKSHPNSPRAWYGKATALDQLAAKKKSNFILEQAIDAYKKVTSGLSSVKDKLFILAAERCIDRMRFRGVHARAVPIHKLLISRFPDDPTYQNQLAVTYLMINRSPEAKQVLENVLQKWPRNGFAQVHYGFILKTGNYNMTKAVRYLQEGIATREPGTIDGRFFFQLGDALMRLGRRKEAMEVNELGVREGLFLSKYQRSLYNVDRLHAQPWWTPEETTYAPYFRKLEENWKQIKDEGVKALYDKNKNLFRDEAENLKDSGKWKQLELFARGRKVPTNCAKAPVTCKLIEDFPAARDCRRGQVKFSVMDPGTHVWPHCGPTNCRLRAHLGLVVPKNTFIRVADEMRTWEEGKLFIFDDSFEHEVWHNGTTTRLVLIVDVWHPELTMEEKRTLPAI